MPSARHALKFAYLGSVAALVLGCATVSPQAVLLSRSIGTDLTVVQTSYRQLIRTHFQDQRARINTFIETRWKPAYLNEFIQRGRLVQTATDPSPSIVLEGIQDWVTVAFEEIGAKRDSLLGPVNAQEDSLLLATDEAFAQVLRGNAAITAHLESLRRVEVEQNALLERTGLKSLRDRIDMGLARASDRTQSAINSLESERKRLESVVFPAHR